MDGSSQRARHLRWPLAAEKKLLASAIVFVAAFLLFLGVCLLAKQKVAKGSTAAGPDHSWVQRLHAPQPSRNRDIFYTSGRFLFLNVKHKDIPWSAEAPANGKATRNPGQSGVQIVHIAHHKTGTVWFSRLFQIYEIRSNMKFRKGNLQACFARGIEACQINNAAPQVLRLLDSSSTAKQHRTLMTVRDPRDVAVSAYFYHKVSQESWLQDPREEYGGKSLQQVLNDSSKEEGINVEIDLMCGGLWDDGASGPYITALRKFLHVNDSSFALVKYEDMWAAEQEMLGQAWASIGSWYGIDDPWSLKVFTLSGVKVGQEATAYRSRAREFLVPEDTGKDHFRKGSPGDWKNHMSRNNKKYAKENFGDLLIDLGYERSGTW